jgi:D-lactate dehydrogenase (cytochrome)
MTKSAKKAASGENDSVVRFVAELCLDLDPSQVDVSPEECEARGKPWNSYHKEDNYPDVIVTPHNTEDVSKIVKLCYKYDIPIVPFGGGTSLEGQTLAPKGGCSVDFNKMKEIIELNEVDLDVTVQAGIGYIELNEILKARGVPLWFPLDPGPGASIGGMCGTRCSGSTAVRYGSMRENVLNVTAVLADKDGTTIKTGSRARKSSAGYDLTRLLIGSEGTLALITEATLKLHPIPKHSYALRIAFPSVFEASCCARDTLSSGITVGRCELLDEVCIKDINAANPNMPGGAWEEEVTLLYELTGPSDASVREQIEIVREVAAKNKGGKFAVATEPAEVAHIWKTRKECLWSSMSQRPELEPMITDVCVPLSNLPTLIQESRKELDASFLHCPVIAHAGDGNFHTFLMFHPDKPHEYAEAKRLADMMADKAIALGGTCTGEHGIGVGKKQHLRKEMGAGSMRVMEQIKGTVDSKRILNPGKIL